MSYCLNPTCSHPDNLALSGICESCGHQLLLRDRYRVSKALGQGGFGATFLAQDESLPGTPSCVVKQLRPSATAPHVLQMARELFEREARTLGMIGNHPQVPRLLDYFEDHDQFYLVQEYISGATLQQEVKRAGPFSEAGVKQFLSEILPMLDYIHSQQVIHRDIKPANLIRRSQDAKLVLIDFGAVKNQVSQALTNTENTALTAYAIGTPGFAPPEQMAMRPVYASDIYAVGVTCIYLLTGKSPKDLEYNITTGEMIWQQRLQLSAHLSEVLRKMLEVSVRSRYQSAEEALRALNLEPYLDGLKEGLVTKKPSTTVVRDRLREDSEASNSYASGGSNPSVAQVAAAIRARRAKFEANTASASVSNGRGVISKSTADRSSSLSTSEPRKLNTEALVTAYVKGRRDFTLHNLSLLNLQGVNLSEANFYDSVLNKTNLQGANLHNSDFGHANLNRANLRDANLSRAYLSNADLECADLRGADLSCAYLNNANLRGANLCGANLTAAKITEEQLALAKTNWMTVRPNGKRGLL